MVAKCQEGNTLKENKSQVGAALLPPCSLDWGSYKGLPQFKEGNTDISAIMTQRMSVSST